MIPEVLTPSAEMHLYLKVFNLVHLFPCVSVYMLACPDAGKKKDAISYMKCTVQLAAI